MESDSDGEEAAFSGMRLPPLINQLKRILAEYPDGGQILKELIQNAEDADATEVRFMYDQRSINQNIAGCREYRKFFKGPALCVYNNALFQEEDWEGIRMIDMSVKESEPLKVGRFGLGFKSVFHLTDYPCILSGDKLLLIDPQKERDKVNAIMRLDRLGKYKRMDVEAFFTALGSFGINRETLQAGKFQGTLFWFPLRETGSELSSKIYNYEMVMTLLETIKKERHSLLIFLKSLTCIRIDIKTPQDKVTTYVLVEVENVQDVSKKRSAFKEGIDYLTKHGGSAVKCELKMEVSSSVSENGKEMTKSSLTWLVVNYFMGNNASAGFIRLIDDQELGLSPYVSIGSLVSGEEMEGHVFCFLPLPREDTSLTGLPVHVNGFFALNQSRHHVKWSTEEQRGHQISDKNVLWNKYLISEALPIAYSAWFKRAIKLANSSQNDVNYIKAIHGAIPVSANIKGKWKEMLSPLFRQLENLNILFSCNQKEWVTVSDSLFKDASSYISDENQQAVVKALTLMGENYVKIPKGVIDTLIEHSNIEMEKQLVSPFLLSQILRNDEDINYKSMSSDEKMILLTFLLQENDFAYLEDLELLPLASGKWTSFVSDDETDNVYLCDEEEVQLFPGLEDQLLLTESKLIGTAFKHFKDISETGMFQLKVINEQSDIETLLQGVLIIQMPGISKMTLKKTGKHCNLEWLQNVWKYLVRRSFVTVCEEVPIIPLLCSGTWKNPEVQLITASNKLIMKEQGRFKLQNDVVNCLKTLSIDVLPSLPDWLPFKEVQSYVYKPDPQFVVKILSYIQQHYDRKTQCQLITQFNCLERSWRTHFMMFICESDQPIDLCKNLISEFEMFESVGRPGYKGDMLSVSEENNYFVKFDTFPINLPLLCIKGSGKPVKLLQQLGAEHMKHSDIVIMTLKYILKGKYREEDILVFMKYVIDKFGAIIEKCTETSKTTLIQFASQISFMKATGGLRKPEELFDPRDKTLQDLFKGEFVFPEGNLTDNTRNTLLILGLKTRQQLTASDIITSARILDNWSKNRNNSKDASLKSKAMLDIFSTNPQILERYCEGKPLKHLLWSLEIIEPRKKRASSFPQWLPWYQQLNLLNKPSEIKGVKYACLVGSVMPVFECSSDQLSAAFLWDSSIPSEAIVKQQKIVKHNYKAKYKPELLGYLQQLYSWLDIHIEDPHSWKNIDIIWVGKQFCSSVEVLISRQENDLNLKPFFFYIPAEFEEFSNLFEALGCNNCQNIDVLLKTLSKIQESKDSRYCPITVEILRRLADNIDDISEEIRKKILIPIHMTCQGSLEFKAIEDCTFIEDPDDYLSDDEDDGDEDIIYLVHKSVPADVASTLGIQTLQGRHLTNTEEIYVEDWGQHEPLTTRLKRLIEEGYVDGLSVPKELLQNADDAGASCLKLLYDERENFDSMEKLLNQGMRTCHGPSLWVYNDAMFSDQDFVNITKLNAATKKEDVQTIGKFGLGFCSVYNLTDVPSIVSGNNIVIFDPHTTHLRTALSGTSPGLKINLMKKGNIKLLKRSKDQFKPYSGIFGCDLSPKIPYFDGTLIRLPLRSVEESRVSEIKAEPYSQRSVAELLHLFIDNAINLLIFMQNVQTIEVFHLHSSAKSTSEQKVLFRVARNSDYKSVLSQCNSNQSTISEIQKFDIQFEVFGPIQNIKPKLDIKPMKICTCWIVSWATGTRRCKTMLQDHLYGGNLPLAAVAVPVHNDHGGPKCLSQVGKGSFKTGRLYCFLPIPEDEDIQLPWHLHGCFDMTSDRRRLRVVTEQDTQTHRRSWNESLLEDASVNAFFQLLEHFTRLSQNSQYVFHELWPKKTSYVMLPFVKSFFKFIITEDVKIFESAAGWVCFKDIVILDPVIRENKTIGQIALSMLQYFPIRTNLVIVDMPRQTIEELQLHNAKTVIELINSKIISCEEMMKIFFLNISNAFWDSRTVERDKLVKYALKTNSEMIHNLLKNTRCIPCLKSSELKMPGELIHPTSSVSTMFCVDDGIFPASEFRDKSVLQALVQHGMIHDILPIDILIQRIQSIESLAEICTSCAKIRINAILDYLKKDDISKYHDNSHFYAIRDTFWLPVLQKPANWKFSWFADRKENVKIFSKVSCNKHSKTGTSLILGAPSKLYEQTKKDYIASVSNVIDSTNFGNVNTRVWQMIGTMNIDAHSGIRDIVNHLVNLLNEYDPKLTYDSFSNMYRKIVRVLQTNVTQIVENNELLSELSDKNVVLLENKELVIPCKVAIDVKEPCYPYLCKLPVQYKEFSYFFKVIGVCDEFTIDTITYSLIEIYQDSQAFDKNYVILSIKILYNLVDLFEKNKTTYMDYRDYHDVIVGPDVTGRLYPTHKLALDDQTFNASFQIKIIHDSFPRSLAKVLGIKSKKSKCLQQIGIGIPWGQKEKLETRIQGILEDYPCDDSILKELLQNADDANAKELHFIMDFQEHPTDRILSEGQLQGPSLCVYNDGYFTEMDLHGITYLGIGSKRKDASKTGQFGIGFNAVYHLTDTPSFLTMGPGLDSGVLCILDPLCCEIPVDETNPGLRVPKIDVQKNFPNTLSGFLEQTDTFFKCGKGTMFRFPLRKHESVMSKHTLSDNELGSLLKSFSERIFDHLLFVKSIEKIQISSMRDNKLEHEYSLTIMMSEEDRQLKENFFSKVKASCVENRDSPLRNLEIRQLCVNYEVEVKDSKGDEAKWLIFQIFGRLNEKKIDQRITEAFSDEQLGHLPIGGVAIPYPAFYKFKKEQSAAGAERSMLSSVTDYISSFSSIFNRQSTLQISPTQKRGKLFAFLPLPLESGFMIHINAHFSLVHSRRDVWEDGYRGAWNRFLGENTIVISWIKALEYLQKQHFTQSSLSDNGVNSQKQLMEMLNAYHALFPVLENLTHHYSKVLVKQFYDTVYSEEIALFPVTICDGISLSVTWVSLKKANEMFGTVFIEKTTRENDNLHKVLKELGMNLVETPKQIYKTLIELGYREFPLLNPEFLIEFLKSFQSEQPGSCTIGDMDVSIENTRYFNEENLLCIVEYISTAEIFNTAVEKLPILLTADLKVHMMRKDTEIYHSKFANLLPSSMSVFVHREFLNLFSKDVYFTERYLKKLDIERFWLLLNAEPLEEFKSGTAVDWDKAKTDRLITSAWISQFYLFIKLNTKDDDPVFVSALLDKFNQYSFLPAVFTENNEHKYKLLPLSLAFRLYHDYRYDNRVHKVISKLNIPTLDASVFDNYSLKRKLYSMIANTRSPLALLKCLHHHKRRFEVSNIDVYDANILLSFFESNLEELEEDFSKQYIRELPLHLSYDGILVHLHTAETLILPGGVPKAGIQEWSSSLNTIVLREKPALVKLYEYLRLSGSNKTEFYAKWLVPNIDYLPNQHWITHFKAMRNLIGIQDVNSMTLLGELQNLRLFSIGNHMKRACELFWHDIDVFKVMLDDNHFPPTEYREEEWRQFCVLLGMQFVVTDELLIEFAETIEQAGLHHISKKLKKQSKVVFDNFIRQSNNGWSVETLNTLKNVKFILPCKVDETLKAIHAQPDSCSKLISFAQSVSVKHHLLCWSSMNMLSDLPNDRNMVRILEIFSQPPLDKVILHCQNITISLQDKLNKRTISPTYVKHIMEIIYAYLDENSETDIAVVTGRLEEFPMIFLPLHQTLVKAKAVVINMDLAFEMRPILYKAPTYFGKYFDLFEKLGSKKIFEVNHCVYILQELKLKTGDDPMIKEELHIVKKVLTKMIDIVRSCKEIDSIEGTLYLPSRQRALKDSRKLTISDNPYYERHLEDRTEINYFLDFAALEVVDYIDTAAFFRKLPGCVRPTILSDVVNKRIMEDEIQEVENSQRALAIQQFLSCEYFVQGFLRLVKSHMVKINQEFVYQKHSQYIRKKIAGVQVVSALNLKSVLIYNGNMVPGTETDETYFVKMVNAEECIFYLSENKTHLHVMHLNRGITHLLKTYTRYDIEWTLLSEILLLFDNPAAIPEMLDSLRIDGLGTSQRHMISVFPKPGQRVENIFLPFLENAIVPFKREEYGNVAMELEDSVLGDYFNESLEDDTSVYIYVHIVKEMEVRSLRSDIQRKYLVETGNVHMPYEEVPIYRLYRFVRRNNTHRELVRHDDEPVGAIPFDETSKRIRDMLQEAWTLPEYERKRIIKRLIKKWHPDRNRGNEEYCQSVLNYIQNVILLLERGQQVSNVVDQRSYRSAPNMSGSSYHNIVMNVNRQTTVYARAYHANIDEYNRENRTGRFDHNASRKTHRPDIMEARRWMRQAKNDFRAANASNTTARGTDGHNWICYTCHQACEKALRAALFSKDANNVPGITHSLDILARSLGEELRNQVVEIESRLTDHNRMRYPDSVSRPNIPSDLYTEDHAKIALEKTKKLLDTVENEYNIL